jgi:signal transduction histidine kinase
MQIDPAICSWDTSSLLLIFSDNVFGDFIYYSHLLPVVCVLTFLFVLLRQSFKDTLVRILTVMGLSFTAWSYSDLVLWADANPDHIMFFWSILAPFELLIYISSLYFVLFYINRKFPNWKFDLLVLILSLPVLLFTHTTLNLEAFDYTNCYREAAEGSLISYLYIIEIFIVIGLTAYTARALVRSVNDQRRTEITLVSLGTILFLLSFSFGNIIGTLEVDYELGQYGMFALPFFIGLLAYMSAKYHTFNIKVIGAEILVTAIIILITSLLFVRTIENARVITIITAVATTLLGYMLIKGVKREIAQKQEIEILALSLKDANDKLKVLDKMKSEFVSIASHQLRSPLTSIRGYASMLSEGSYGKLTAKAQEVVDRIGDSAKYMALSVEDYLNVSRIEAGNMKYEMSEFNLKEVAEKLVDEMRPVALKKGLVMVFRSDCDGSCSVNADIGKTRQIIMNLIDNAMKYTPKGTITVVAHDDPKKKKMYVTIQDTGVGMSKETQEEVFEKFVRAKNANNVNVTGTGLGLFVAKKMIVDMKGRVWAESEGEGKGSTFTIELPLLSGKTPGR